MPFEITNTLRSSSIIRVEGTGTTTVALANLSVNANETVSAANIKLIGQQMAIFKLSVILFQLLLYMVQVSCVAMTLVIL
jgi:hypothetical protein